MLLIIDPLLIHFRVGARIPNLSGGLKCHHIVSVSQNFKTLLDMSRGIGAFINLTNSIYSPAEGI